MWLAERFGLSPQAAALYQAKLTGLVGSNNIFIPIDAYINHYKS